MRPIPVSFRHDVAVSSYPRTVRHPISGTGWKVETMNETLRRMNGNPIGSVIVTVIRMIGAAIGLALVIISIPFAITPIPLGLPLFIIGVLLLAGSSKTAHRHITNFLKRHPVIWNRVKGLFGGDKDHTPTGWGGPEYAELCPTDDHPVVLVDWFDAYAYARWAGGRLPTEAEWERSARGLSDLRRYPWGDEPVDEERASYGRLTYGPDPVGSRPSGASADGVQDLAGNVWEWCGDRYDPAAYRQLPSESPHMAMTTDARVRAVKRGGSWTNAPLSLRVSKRGFELLATRRPNLGFRCVVESR